MEVHGSRLTVHRKISSTKGCEGNRGTRDEGRYIVSACLVGINCRYDGKNKLLGKVQRLVSQGRAIPVCPEQLGGLPTPRLPMEIRDGSGEDVLGGRTGVFTKEGVDVTTQCIKGAHEVLKLAKLVGARAAILKARSPSCGFGRIYDGTFTNNLRKGNGVTASLLRREGVKILTEEELN
ncbi:MAG: DUF523 domain-containing protein [Actinomycetota bacterium]|nr:DUF523 domain-containing protein [Actinomycetota bacterium]